MAEVSLVIPTYRLKDVAETVLEYHANLDKYGHDLPVIVFDDSTIETHLRDFSTFTSRVPPQILYVGPREKAGFLALLVEKLGAEHEPALRRMLRPSYGGNRNHTLLYTLGEMFISADDDMRPHGLFHRQRELLNGKEVLKGLYIDKTDPEQVIVQEEFDLVTVYLSVLGKSIRTVNGSCELVGSTLIDSMMDLYTNQTKGPLQPNTITLVEGEVNPQARIVTAQTYRSGSADVDAIDYANDFLINPYHAFVNDMSLRYVIQAFKPCVTSTNWRLDCGISGYDNSKGLPPFFPTQLRFEDYVFRLWLQDAGVAAAHVNGVQAHYRNPYMRESLPHDLWNEAMANFLKPRLKEQIVQINPTTLVFNGEIHVSGDESRKIVEEGRCYYVKALQRAATVVRQRETSDPLSPEQKSNYLIGFARDVYDEYEGFDVAAFQRKMQRTIDDEMKAIVSTMTVWPDVLEAASELKQSENIPLRKIGAA